MRIGLFIILFLSSYIAFGQGLEPSQIQGAPKLNDILQAKNMYIDEYGDTLYIYQHTSLDGLTTTYDSIYVSNDSIRLKYGSGFVKIPKLKAGQTTTIQTLITGDTIYAGVNTNSLDSTHVKFGGIARNDLSFAIDESKWEQASTNLYPKNLSSDVGVGTNNPLSKLHVSNGDVFIIGGSNRRFLLGSSASTGFWSGMRHNSSNQLEILHSGTLHPSILITSSGLMGFNTQSTAPSRQFTYGTTAGGDEIFQRYQYGPSSTAYNLEFGQKVTSGNVRWQFSQSNASTLYNNVLTFDRGNVAIGAQDADARLHVAGDLIVTSRTGAAFTGLGVTTGGKIVDLGYIPISNYQTISSTGAAGNITLSNGGGTLNLNVNDADASATNEIDVLRVGTSVTGGGRLQNATNGFNQASEIGLVITGTTASVSTGINGSITWTLPDASDSNELQTISKDGTTKLVTLSNSGGSFTDEIGPTYTAGTGININGSNVISNTGDVSNTNELQTLVWNSGTRVLEIIGGNTVTLPNYLLSEVDGSTTNEGLMSLSGASSPYTYNSNTSGSTPLIIAAGSNVTIGRSTNTLTINATDNVGPTYTASTGININGSNQISNTGDVSNTNELDTLTIGGGRLVAVSQSGINFAANGVGFIGNTQVGVTPIGNNFNFSINNGSITPTQLDRTYLTSFTEVDGSVTNELNTSFVKSGNTITVADAGASRSVNISQTVTPSSGQVLKWDGAQWNADTDLNTGVTYTAGTGININGSNVISNTGDVSNTNELQTLVWNSGTRVLEIIGGNTVTLPNYLLSEVDGSTTNEGLMSLSGASSPYTYNSNTSGSTPLIIAAGSNVTIGRSTNTLTINATDNVGPTYTAGTGINISGGNVISNTGDISNTNEGLMSLTTNTSNNYTYNSNTSSSVPLILNAGTNMSFSRTGNEITFNASGGGGGLTGSGTATRVAFWDGTSSLSSDAQLYWDNSNKFFGVGTSSPSAKLHVSTGDVFIIGGTGRRFLMGSSTSAGFYGGMTWNSSNLLEINHSSFLSPAQIINSSGFTGIRTLGGDPVAPLDVYSASSSDNASYQRWAYDAAPTSYNLLLKQTVTGGNVRYNFSQVNAGTSYNNVLVFDQGNLGIGVTDATRKLDINGEVRIRDLTTTTPTRLVSADADGVVSSLTIGSGLAISGGQLQNTATSTNIYNSDGTISATRTVSLLNRQLWFEGVSGSESSDTRMDFDGFGNYAGASGGAFSDIANSASGFLTYNNAGFEVRTTGSTARVGYNVSGFKGFQSSSILSEIVMSGTNLFQMSASAMTLTTPTLTISANGTDGNNNQVLTSDGTNTSWQNNPALDNLYNTSTGSVTFNTGSDAAVFGIGTSAQYCSATSTTFTKSSSSAVYEIDIVVNNSASLGDESIFLGLFRSGSQIASCKQFNAVGTTGTDMIFKFMTDSSSGGLTIRNIGASSFTGTVKHIAIKRLR